MTCKVKPVCLCCTSTDIYQRFHVYNRHNNNDNYNILQCNNCGFGFVYPSPDISMAPEYFNSYWDGNNSSHLNGILERIILGYKRFLYWTEASMIIRLCGKGKILDVGSGDGVLLSILKEKGCEVMGTEVSRVGFNHSIDKYGIKMHLGNIETLNQPLLSFDTIVLSNVLEHVSDPVSVLITAHRLLKADGTIYIVVPNSDSIQAKWLKEKWFAVHPPEHLYYFTATSLTKLLSVCGFEQITIKHGLFRQSPALLVSSLFPMLEPFRVQSENLSFKPLRQAALFGLTYVVLPFLFIEKLLHRSGMIVVTAHIAYE